MIFIFVFAIMTLTKNLPLKLLAVLWLASRFM